MENMERIIRKNEQYDSCWVCVRNPMGVTRSSETSSALHYSIFRNLEFFSNLYLGHGYEWNGFQGFSWTCPFQLLDPCLFGCYADKNIPEGSDLDFDISNYFNQSSNCYFSIT